MFLFSSHQMTTEAASHNVLYGTLYPFSTVGLMDVILLLIL